MAGTAARTTARSGGPRRAPARRRMPPAGSTVRPPRVLVRRDGPLGGYESALGRAGFDRVAGADEAGRGACAGPLVVAACILPAGRRGQITGLDDSKVLTPAVRERLYGRIVARAEAWTVVVIPAAEIDAWGLHVANLAGMRRALGTLTPAADYALTDGFPVAGLAMPATAVWKGDATIACVAAASILAKVTRDRIMTAMHDVWPQYEFATHKGYITPTHARALTEAGPCPQHRRRYVNVRRALLGQAGPTHLGTTLSGLAPVGDNPLDDPTGEFLAGPAAEDTSMEMV